MACKTCNKTQPAFQSIQNEPKFVIWIIYIFTCLFLSIFGFAITAIMLSNVFWGNKDKIKYMKENSSTIPLIYNIESNSLKIICFIFIVLGSLLLSWLLSPFLLYKQYFPDAKDTSSVIE